MRFNSFFVSVLICSSLLGFSLNLQAEDQLNADYYRPQLDTAKVYELNEVEIVDRHVTNSMVPFQRMDSKVLTKMSCQNVADAIRFFSGVQLKDFGGVGGLKTINIRNMGTQQMAVFYDGIQLGNAQNGQIDLGKFSLDNIEAINLYNGQKTDVLQSARDYGAAGTVYLESKVPEFTHHNYVLSAGMKAGSFGLANPSLLWQQKWSDKICSSVSAEYMYAHGKYKYHFTKVMPDGHTLYDTTLVRQNADINAVRAEAAVFGKVKNGEWRAQVYNYYSERGLPGYVARNVYEHHDRQWDENFFVQGRYKQQINSFYSLMAQVKYAYDYTRYLSPDTITMYVDNTYEQQEVYASLANSFKAFSWWNLGVSADFQWNHLDANVQSFVHPNRYTGMVSAVTDFHFPHVKFQASVLGTFIQDVTDNGTKNRNVVTPAAFLSVRPMKDVSFDIRAFYKRAFRMPTFNDLYYTFIGNSNLEPELCDQVDVGVNYRYLNAGSWFEGFSIQADGYYNWVKNKIVAIPASNPFRWQMMNFGQVEIGGLDLVMDMNFTWARDWGLLLKGTYSYQVAQDLSNPDSPFYGDQIPYAPWHSASAIVQLSYKDWSLNYSFIYTGERYDQSANIPMNYIQPWYTHDLSLSKLFVWDSWKLWVSVDLNNIADQSYEVVLNYPMPGFNGKVSLKFSYY